jgi:hypothetical protein
MSRPAAAPQFLRGSGAGDEGVGLRAPGSPGAIMDSG